MNLSEVTSSTILRAVVRKCQCCNAPSDDYVKALERRLDKALEALGRIRHYPATDAARDGSLGVIDELQAIAKEGMK